MNCQFETTDKPGEYRCTQCRQTIRPKVYKIEQVALPCSAAIELTAMGMRLAAMQPGDVVARVLHAAFVDRILQKQECGPCADRQEWMNAQWQAWVSRHFSKLSAPTTTTAHPAESPSQTHR